MNLEPLLKSVALAEARGSLLSMTPTEVRILAAELADLEAKIIEQSSRLDDVTKERDEWHGQYEAAERNWDSEVDELREAAAAEYRLLTDIKDDLVLRAGFKANAVDLSASIWNRLCDALAKAEAE
jgi:hypothetical protein